MIFSVAFNIDIDKCKNLKVSMLVKTLLHYFIKRREQHFNVTRLNIKCINKNYNNKAGPRSAIGRAPDSQVRGPGFDTRSGNILSFLLPLFQEGQLSVTGESMCTKYWLTA